MTDDDADETRFHDLHALGVALGRMYSHGLLSEETMSIVLTVA
ncbi:hypothetical protein [Bifidobacterium mongoliense]|nr:hypothetical protein [Bifidobacterium mongoliense]